MFNRRSLFCGAMFLLFGFSLPVNAQPKPNYDENLIAPYTLPDPLICNDGTKVTDAKMWKEKRRPELLELFRANMQGRSPGRPAEMKFNVDSTDPNALQGLATRKEIVVSFSEEKDGPQMRVLLYIPNASIQAKTPAPIMMGMNFDGNHTVNADPGITITPQWTWNSKEKKETLTTPAASTRGSSVGRWGVETIMARGYALATIQRADLEPDYAEGWKHGIRGYYMKKSGKSEFAPDDWGAVAAWAWGLSRALDYLETEPTLDTKHVMLTGHSRLGKASLWAGAEDERFSIVVSNNSGEGGAAIARRNFGETTTVINSRFPHWFCGNFKKFSDNENKMPFDQHELVALSAPRPVYIASAVEDQWADPRGEFLAGKGAESVYKLFGKEGLGTNEFPKLNDPIGNMVGYHIRSGKHDVTDYDWQQYLNFADRHFGRQVPAATGQKK